MTPEDAIPMFAEVSVALAGFAGVASAFAGRDRTFREIERTRLLSMVGLSASVLAGSLVYVSISMADGPAEQATRYAALMAMAPTCLVLFAVAPNSVRHMNDADSTASPLVMVLSVGLGISAVILYGTIALFPEGTWKLGLCFSLQILHSLWMFLRFLTRAN